MPLGTILLIILVILLIGALPAWPYSAAWGPYPAGILGNRSYHRADTRASWTPLTRQTRVKLNQ